MKKFEIKKSLPWEACVCCSTRENLNTLKINYVGGHHGCSITLCKDCMLQLGNEITKKVSK